MESLKNLVTGRAGVLADSLCCGEKLYHCICYLFANVHGNLNPDFVPGTV